MPRSKRIAAAVGEGAQVVAQLHAFFREQSARELAPRTLEEVRTR